MTGSEAPYPLTQINQVALVVRDLDAAVREYWERFQIGPWRIMTFGPDTVRELYYRGEPARFKLRAAFAMCGGLQLELIESVAGPNIYEEFLSAHGEGMHHVGIWVPDLQAGIAELERRGYVLIQAGFGTGLKGDGGFAYFETEAPLKLTLELIEVPKERPAPVAVYPPEG